MAGLLLSKPITQEKHDDDIEKTDLQRLYTYSVTGDGADAYWTKVGTAWAHGKGGVFNIELTAIPVNGRIVLMLPKAENATEARGAQCARLVGASCILTRFVSQFSGDVNTSQKTMRP